MSTDELLKYLGDFDFVARHHSPRNIIVEKANPGDPWTVVPKSDNLGKETIELICIHLGVPVPQTI